MNLVRKLVFRKMTPMEEKWLKLRKKLNDYRDETYYQSKIDEILSIVPQDADVLFFAVQSASKLYNFILYSTDLGMAK